MGDETDRLKMTDICGQFDRNSGSRFSRVRLEKIVVLGMLLRGFFREVILFRLSP
jgi:hypothetical protein